MILVLGKSTLADAIKNELFDVKVVGKPEYNFSSKEDCKKLVLDYSPDVVINSFALNENNDPWDILITNFVATTYITDQFYRKLQNKHIINISSASTHWVSFPGISTGRLFYNLSKECVSNFGKHYNRKIIDDSRNTVSTIEIPRFASKFNNFQSGIDINKILNAVKSCIDNKNSHLTILK